jgi:excisionase family DNA binding protein
MVITEDKGLSVKDAATRLGVSRSTAWRMVASGELRHLRVGKRVIIPVSVTNEYLANAR